VIRKILIIAAMIAGSVLVSAQTPTIEVGKSYTIAWDWSQGTGGPATGFKVEVNGVELALDPPLGAATRSAILPGPVSCAPLTIRVGAYNAVTTSWTAPLTANVIGCPPNPPTNLRIVVVITQQADGSFTFKIETIEAKK
jgi:hypothetical protein